MAGFKRTSVYTIPPGEPDTPTVILSGTADPEATDGNDGDFWINTTTTTIFGPKAAGAWPEGTELIGPQGIQGTQGAPGAQGPQGESGVAGALDEMTDVTITNPQENHGLLYDESEDQWVNGLLAGGGFGGGSFGDIAPNWIQLGDFDDQPPSTSTITMTADLTATVKVGFPVKFKRAGAYYFAIVTAITANLLTIAGAPLTTGDGDLQELWIGDPCRVVQLPMFVPGWYEDADDAAIIEHDIGRPFRWYQSLAYCVRFAVSTRIADANSDGKVNVTLAGSGVSTSNGGLGLALPGTSTYTTVVDIDTAHYFALMGDAVDASVTKGGTGDAQDLMVYTVWVIP